MSTLVEKKALTLLKESGKKGGVAVAERMFVCPDCNLAYADLPAHRKKSGHSSRMKKSDAEPQARRRTRSAAA